MDRKILLVANIVLLAYVLSVTVVHGENVQQEVNVKSSNKIEAINQRQKRDDDDDDNGDDVSETTTTTGTTSGGSSIYGSRRIPVGSGTYEDDKYDTYDNNKYDDNKYDSYTSDKSSKKTGYKGNKGYKNNYPFQYNEYKVGDSSESEEGVSMAAAIDIWILETDNWESDRRSYYRGKGSSKYKKTKKYNKYEKSDKYDDDEGYDGYDKYDKSDKYDNSNYKKDRSKRSYSRVKFPVRHFPNIRDFPIKRIPPLISILPWLPIFYDKLTYQTFIFSPTGGMYILPALINHFGQRFSVAQLIKWGYASLVSSGIPPPPNVNVAPLVQPPPPVTEPGTGGGARSAPSYDSQQHRFTEGLRTDFRSFRPRYPQVIYESGNNYNVPSYNSQRTINSGYSG